VWMGVAIGLAIVLAVAMTSVKLFAFKIAWTDSLEKLTQLL
jgi:hypothetical protein